MSTPRDEHDQGGTATAQQAGEAALAGAGHDVIFQQALAPERRYESITLDEPRQGYPGDLALFFKFTDNNGTNVVNLRPGDMPALRAAVISEDPAGKDIADRAIMALGPGARKYCAQSHAAGYRLGVSDMEAVHESLPEAERVLDWLGGFYESGSAPEPGCLGGKWTGEDQAAISRVRELIDRQLSRRETF